MDTTLVAQSVVTALAALGGASMGVLYQRSNERRRQRERAAEVLGSVRPLLTELHPGHVMMQVYLADVWAEDWEVGQQDPGGEALTKLAKLDERVALVRAQLSALAGWWPTARGLGLAEQLEAVIFQIRNLDQTLVEDFQHKKNAPDAVNRAVEAAVEAGDDPNVRKRAFEVWEMADTVASQLRAEIRGDAAPQPPKLLLPAQPESWTGPGERATPAPPGLPTSQRVAGRSG